MPVPPTPYINIQNGQVTGTIQKGQPFYWYNPTSVDVTIKNVGAWCSQDSYLVSANSGTQAGVLQNPNTFGCSWTEVPNQFNVPGMPHISAPTLPREGKDEAEKEVA